MDFKVKAMSLNSVSKTILENENKEISNVLEEPLTGGFCDIWEIEFKTAKRAYRKGFRCKNFRIPAITQCGLL
jgi:hypothetical protein